VFVLPYYKITVEQPLRLNFAATPDRIAQIEDQTPFKNLAKSKKRSGPARDAQIAAGQARQDQIRHLLKSLSQTTNGALTRERDAFLATLAEQATNVGMKLSAPERKAILAALSEPDPQAATCRDRQGKPEPDARLRDTENVPLGDDINEYMTREVLSHIPDAWVDHAKTKTGYEIPLNKHFYVYEPPRPLGEIKTDLQTLETEIAELLSQITA